MLSDKISNKNKTFYYHFTSQITKQDKFYINKPIIKMLSNNKLKKVDIKNRTKKPHKNVFVYSSSYKNLIDSKPIKFDEIDGFDKVYDGTRYLVLF